MRLWKKIFPLFLSFGLLVFFAACDTENGPTTPDDPDVSAPTNFLAYSDDGKVGLTWNASTSESQSNFGTYEITFQETGSTSTQIRQVAKGNTSYVVDGLTNGKKYTFTIRSKTTKGKQSTDFRTLEWSPAVRNAKDINNQFIDVYATSSAQPKSGLVFNGTGNKCEVLSQAGADWKQRGDVYLYGVTGNNTLKMNSAHLAVNNPGQKTTKFSTVVLDVDDLGSSGALSSPPAASTYSDSFFEILDGQTYSKSKMYWARIQGTGTNTHTVRFIVVRDPNSGQLVRGSGADRYVRLEVSMQTDPNNPYAKK